MGKKNQDKLRDKETRGFLFKTKVGSKGAVGATPPRFRLDDR